MWNTVSIVFCVLLVVVSFLFLPFSIACLILLITSGVVLVHELQWNVNLSQLKIWLKSSLESLMDNKSSKSKPFPRVLNSNGVSKNHSLLMTNNFKASPNLTPQSKFVNETIVSDTFKMSLNDCNKHSTPISMSGSRNYKSDRLEDERSSWSNIKSKKDQSITIQKNVQSVAGPLLVSTRFNSNISSELSANASSAGFSSRLAQKGAEMASTAVTHQPKYAGVGVFPVVQLQSRSPKHHISSPARSVRVRIAPPDNSPLCGNMDTNDFSNVNGGEDSVRSVLQVLKEISRKRIHSQVDEDGDESVKRPKKDRIEENLTKSLDPAVQNKRGREDSPRSSGEEAKRQRRHLNGGKAAATAATAKSSNEIMSSLSSSLAVKPPHLCKQQQSKATKRKAHAVDWSRCSTPVSGKVLKVNTSPNQDQDQVVKPSKYQDERPTANQEEVDQGGDQTSWIGGMVRIEAGERRLLARSAGSGALISVEGGGGAEMTSRSPSPPAPPPTAPTPPHPPPQSSKLLKQMADPGQRLKDMLAAINGDGECGIP
ncbi:hypothetical protein LSTR_LSTR008599 [Laodelphax striatellus]|uniref:Uncharacterized protein n=1 Tax=Laodelphax striatellus TaxID=195883 RepID=A0A482WQ76_LAOST|nr:hypothetical protein LSTR_LSTR008599 [Laodelphax striatellus]